MIIEFTISNFRSIRDTQMVSFYAESSPQVLADNIAYPKSNKIGVLKTVGLFGANASGKSNFLLAFEALRFIAGKSGDLKNGAAISCYNPYRLASECLNQPTTFEVEFIVPEGIRYLYFVSFTRNRIVEERLISYASGQPAVFFNRQKDDDWKSIQFGAKYKGGKRKFPFFSNNAYLAKAGNSADAPESIQSIARFFENKIVHLTHDESIYLSNNWQENDSFVSTIGALLRFADTGIEEFGAEKQDFDPGKISKEIPDSLRGAISQSMMWKYLFSHKKRDGNAGVFELKEESDGTKRFFNLAPLLVETLAKGGVLVLDEIESSMHPFMTETIIKLFHDSEANAGNAQLIFSSHDMHLLGMQRFRRDQIIFAEKADGESRFYSAADFDKSVVKSNCPFAKWYLEGRFDAIPSINYRKIVELIQSNRSNDAKEKVSC